MAGLLYATCERREAKVTRDAESDMSEEENQFPPGQTGGQDGAPVFGDLVARLRELNEILIQHERNAANRLTNEQYLEIKKEILDIVEKLRPAMSHETVKVYESVNGELRKFEWVQGKDQ